MKKTVSLLLAVLLLLTLPLPAFAEKAEALPVRTLTKTSPFLKPQMRFLSAKMPLSAVDGTYETSPENAAMTLREGMMAREESITLLFETESEEDILDLAERLFEMALVHDGTPMGGDYLRNSYSVLSITATGYAVTRSGVRTKYLTLQYDFTYFSDAEEEQTADLVAAELLAELCPEDASDEENLLAIYDWICANVRYDYSLVLHSHSACAALLDHSAVCQGYAALFYRLALAVGLDCRVIVGSAAGGLHGWNIVRLPGSDLYYEIDTTFDAGNAESHFPAQCFLRGTRNFTDHSADGLYLSSEFMAEYPISEDDAAFPLRPVIYLGSGDDDCPLYVRTTPNGTAGTLPVPEKDGFDFCGWFIDKELLSPNKEIPTDCTAKALWLPILSSGKLGGLNWTVSESGLLSITGSGQMPDFTVQSPAPWYSQRENITAVSVAGEAENIGENAFAGCTALRSAAFGPSVTELPENMFSDCGETVQTAFLTASSPAALLSASQQNGALRFDLLCLPETAPAVFAAFYDGGKPVSILPVQAAAGENVVFLPEDAAFTECRIFALDTAGYLPLCAPLLSDNPF